MTQKETKKRNEGYCSQAFMTAYFYHQEYQFTQLSHLSTVQLYLEVDNHIEAKTQAKKKKPFKCILVHPSMKKLVFSSLLFHISMIMMTIVSAAFLLSICVSSFCLVLFCFFLNLFLGMPIPLRFPFRIGNSEG